MVAAAPTASTRKKYSVLGDRPVRAKLSAVAEVPVTGDGVAVTEVAPVHFDEMAGRCLVAEGDRGRGVVLVVDRAVEGGPVAVTPVAATVVAVGAA